MDIKFLKIPKDNKIYDSIYIAFQDDKIKETENELVARG